MVQRVTLAVLEEDADPQRLDEVTRHLRQELSLLDVDDVSAARGAEAPEGSRAVDVVAIGGLVLSFGSSELLRSVIRTVRGWLGRSPQPDRKVRLELGGDVLELTGATSTEQERLVELFIARHSGDPAPP